MNAKKMRKIANKYNRKKHKEWIINRYKAIKREIKEQAKQGKNYAGFTSTDEMFDSGINIAVRLFRIKNPSFKTTIEKTGTGYCIYISW